MANKTNVPVFLPQIMHGFCTVSKRQMSVLSVEGSPGGDAAERCDGAVKAGRQGGADKPLCSCTINSLRILHCVFFTAPL